MTAVQKLAIGIVAVAVTLMAWQTGKVPYVALGLTVTWGFYAYFKRSLPIGANQGFMLEVLILLVTLRVLRAVRAHPVPDGFTPEGPLLCVRPYTHNNHYWQVYFDMNAMVLRVSAEAGWPAPTPAQIMFTKTLQAGAESVPASESTRSA